MARRKAGDYSSLWVRGFDLAAGRRISHRWAGIAGTLGFPQLSHKALAIETLLEQPMDQITLALRSGLGELVQLFSDGVRGKLTMPVFSADKDLSGKRFAIVGFEPAEAGRIARALEHSQAFTRTMPAAEALPGSDIFRPFDMVIASVNAQARPYPWTQLEGLKKNHTPLLFVGSREMLLDLAPEVQEQAQDFLIAPWDQDEVVLRACRILSKAARETKAAEAARQVSSVPQPGTRSSATPAQPNGAPQTQHVVIADDDPTITALVKASLKKFGVECHAALDGAQALELTRKLVPGALILDVLMPQFDGFEVLSTLKRDQKTSGVPVIMLTVRQQAADVMRGFAFGAEDYVVKPFNPMELAARIARLLPGMRSAAAA